jgi:hypothetical protein
LAIFCKKQKAKAKVLAKGFGKEKIYNSQPI